MDNNANEDTKDEDNLVEDVQNLMEHLDSLQLSNQPQAPAGMTQNRYLQALIFLHHYRSGKVFAAVDDVFKSDWVAVDESDFTHMFRDDINNGNFHVEIVKEVYMNTREAAQVHTNLISSSQAPMLAGGVEPAKLIRKQFDLVAEGAHLCPKTGPDCKTDTWIYIAAAVLGLPAENSSVLLKALRGSVLAPKKGKGTGDEEKEDATAKDPHEVQLKKKRAPGTMVNTGLNRSPFNLLYMMEHKYIFDLQSCVIALPVMNTEAAKAWNGTPYAVIVLCDNQKGTEDTAGLVAQRLGLTESVVSVATKDNVEDALDLLSSVIKFSAFCLDKMPPPPSPNGMKLWVKYTESLSILRSYATSREGQRAENSVLVPTLDLTHLGTKSIAKLDLQEENEDVTNVVYPDPILLASKSSINWTRKFGFQLIAEAEPQRDESNPYLDPRIDKVIEVDSQGDYSSLGSRH